MYKKLFWVNPALKKTIPFWHITRPAHSATSINDNRVKFQKKIDIPVQHQFLMQVSGFCMRNLDYIYVNLESKRNMFDHISNMQLCPWYYVLILLVLLCQSLFDFGMIKQRDSVWDERGRCSLDGTKRSRVSRRFQKCDVGLFGNVRPCVFMLLVSVSL